MSILPSFVLVILTGLLTLSQTLNATNEVEAVSHPGTDGRLMLSNTTTRVVLDPHEGGRVVEYSLNGKDALYHAPEKPRKGRFKLKPDAGRFDIGPEFKTPNRGPLWDGPYEVEITGSRSVRLSSVKDISSTGVQIIRDFFLAAHSSQLTVTQTLVNIGESTKRYHHWSRTLATGGGICIVPLTPKTSRFPIGYIYYGPGPVLNFYHDEHPNIRIRENCLELIGTPPEPKFGINSYAGWFGYITRDDLLFVKRFPTYPDRRYGEVAGYTISIWYYLDQACELEPIGPTEILAPGERASFTEEWSKLDHGYPEDRNVDLEAFKGFARENAK